MKLHVVFKASTTMSKDHKTLKDGMRWLYMSIDADWDTLNERVQQDMIDTKVSSTEPEAGQAKTRYY